MKKQLINIVLPLATALVATSCHQDAKIADNSIFQLEAIIDTSSDAPISDIAKHFSVVELETTNDALLPRNSHIAGITDSMLFITGSDAVFSFSKHGKFLNMIGSQGQGPMEYTSLRSFSLNERRSIACVFGNGNKIYLWNFNGNPIKELTLSSNGYLSTAYCIGDIFWAEENTAQNGRNEINIVFFDTDGNRISTHPVTQIDGAANPSYLTAPAVHQLNDTTYSYYSEHIGKLLTITPDSITIAQTIDKGRYNVSPDKINDMDYRTTNSSEICEIWDWIRAENIDYILIRHGQEIRCVMLDRNSETCIASNHTTDPRKNGGLKVWKNNDIRVWPNINRHGKIFSLIDFADMADHDKNRIQTLTDHPIATTEDSNPVVLIWDEY